jgi:NADH-quinone oxidoreductase subunit H
LSAINDGMFNAGYWPILWFLAKIVLLMFVFVWLRGTLPRLRYDQFMKLGWKVLIPISLAWIAVVSGMRLAFNEGIDRQQIFVAIGIALGVFVMITLLMPDKRGSGDAREAEPPAGMPIGRGHPVPPMPGEKVDLEVAADDMGATPDEASSRARVREESDV